MKYIKLAEGITYDDEAFLVTFPDRQLGITDISEAVILVLLELEQKHTVSMTDLQEKYISACKNLGEKAKEKNTGTNAPLHFKIAIDNLKNREIIEEYECEANAFTKEIQSKVSKIQTQNILWMALIIIACIFFVIFAIKNDMLVGGVFSIGISTVLFYVHLIDYKTFKKEDYFTVIAVCDGKRVQAFSLMQSSICEFTSSDGETFDLTLATSFIDRKIRQGKRYILFYKKGKSDERELTQQNFIKIVR